MSRLVSYRALTSPEFRTVEATDQSTKGGDRVSGGGEGDAYLQRVAKYIPAEVIGFFVFVNALLKSEVESKFDESIVSGGSFTTASDALTQAARSAALAGLDVQTISWITIGVSMLLIPPYLFGSQDASSEAEWPKLNIVMALLAFPIWAYAVEAVAFRSFYDGTLAAIALAVFTVVSGVVSPEILVKLSRTFSRGSD